MVTTNAGMEKGALDAMSGRAISFTVNYGADEAESRSFTIAPPSIGKMAMISRCFIEMDIDTEDMAKDPMREAARIFCDKADAVCRFMAIAVSNTRDELTDEGRLRELADFFRYEGNPGLFCEMTKIVIVQSDYLNFMQATRLMAISRLRASIEKPGPVAGKAE